MGLSERRMFIQGNEFNSEIAEGTVKRERVCPIEIWCELFNGDKKELTPQRSKEIKDIILKTGEWEQMRYPMKFGELYGNQRGLIKLKA